MFTLIQNFPFSVTFKSPHKVSHWTVLVFLLLNISTSISTSQGVHPVKIIIHKEVCTTQRTYHTKKKTELEQNGVLN